MSTQNDNTTKQGANPAAKKASESAILLEKQTPAAPEPRQRVEAQPHPGMVRNNLAMAQATATEVKATPVPEPKAEAPKPEPKVEAKAKAEAPKPEVIDGKAKVVEPKISMFKKAKGAVTAKFDAAKAEPTKSAGRLVALIVAALLLGSVLWGAYVCFSCTVYGANQSWLADNFCDQKVYVDGKRSTYWLRQAASVSDKKLQKEYYEKAMRAEKRPSTVGRAGAAIANWFR